MPIAAGRTPQDDRALLRGDAGYEPFPAPAAAGSLVARFAAVAARYPDRPAVIVDASVLSYVELDARSKAIAAAAMDGARPSAVALLLDQGAGFVVGFLAALRTGGTVVPLDPAYPDAILAGLLEHASAGTIIADGSTSDLARRVAGTRPVIDLSATWPPPTSPDSPIRPDAPATLFYTSGTTGRPKCVLDSHANVLDNVRRYVDSLAIGPGDRLSVVHGPMFSGLVSSLWSALATGAGVIPIDVRRVGLDRLADGLADGGATMLHLVPSLYRGLLRTSRTWPDVRVVRLEGDAATWDDVQLAESRFAPDVIVVNGLGATETGLVAQHFVRPSRALGEHGAMPVGYPVRGIAVAVMDEAGAPSAPDEPGELVVSGQHLAIGYLGDSERTAAVFTRDESDASRRSYRTGDLACIDAAGCVRVLGRRDGVHKVRGQTVDPRLLERRLLGYPGVTAAAAITRADVNGEARLLGYVVGPVTLDGAEIRRTVARDLPGQLVPSSVVVLPGMPLTAAGKVDRAALPAPDRARPALDVPYEPPRDPLEERLVDVWSTVLDVRPVGIHDAFFDLGGDSLGAASMLLEVGRWLGREVSPDVLARAATVAELAGQLRTGSVAADGELVTLSSGPGPAVVVIHAVGGNPSFFHWVAQAFGTDATVVSIQPPDLRSMSVYEPIAQKAARYVGRLQETQPSGPYHIVGQCFGGLVAHEVARQLVERGEVVGTLTLLGVGPIEFPRLVSASARRRFWRSRWRLRIRIAAGDGPDRSGGVGTRAAVIGVGRLLRRRLSVAAARAGILPGAPRDDRQAVTGFTTMTAVAAALHRPAPFPGRLRVVVGRDARPRYLRDAAHDLARLATGGVEVVVLPGDDHAMLARPGSERLGQLLRAWVDDVEGVRRVD